MSITESAGYPDLAVLREQLTTNNSRPDDLIQRLVCIAQDSQGPGVPSCSGDLNIGLFFDGTGNNERNDYGPENNPFPLRQRKHSNVVRLYHAYPDDAKRRIPAHATNRYYALYIPGVGTPFPQIKDSGSPLGSATAWGGESRILWGLIQVINTIHRYYLRRPLLDDDPARELTLDLANELTNVPDGPIDKMTWLPTWMANMARHTRRRQEAFGRLMTQLRSAIPPNARPYIRQINLSVFGFSRGAAQSRAFVNWLLELCENPSDKPTLAGIPLNIQFMGLFDTVASVGIAGVYSFLEGRQGWAEENMQIPGSQIVRQCVHLVAAHEVRACFPLDSVRVDHTYPENTVEIVYPGAHSDVGGGYLPQALGKDDWDGDKPPSEQDLQLPRITCFDMYCRAMQAGVPFYTVQQLRQSVSKEVADALLPSSQTLADLERYYSLANVPTGPVEDMLRAHMGQYHAWRWKMGADGLDASPEMQRIKEKRNPDQAYRDEHIWVRHTQHALIQVIAAYCNEIDRRIQSREGGQQPLINTWRIPSRMEKKRRETRYRALPVGEVPMELAWNIIDFFLDRKIPLIERSSIQQAHVQSRLAPQKLVQWRQWLASQFHPEWHDPDAELEAIWLLDAVAQADQLPSALSDFFARHVHDSMAGFIGMGLPEFEVNGHGLAKFRRIYFGDRGTAVLRDRVDAENKARQNRVGTHKAHYLQQTTPPRVPPMGQWFPRM